MENNQQLLLLILKSQLEISTAKMKMLPRSYIDRSMSEDLQFRFLLSEQGTLDKQIAELENTPVIPMSEEEVLKK